MNTHIFVCLFFVWRQKIKKCYLKLKYLNVLQVIPNCQTTNIGERKKKKTLLEQLIVIYLCTFSLREWVFAAHQQSVHQESLNFSSLMTFSDICFKAHSKHFSLNGTK